MKARFPALLPILVCAFAHAFAATAAHVVVIVALVAIALAARGPGWVRD